MRWNYDHSANSTWFVYCMKQVQTHSSIYTASQNNMGTAKRKTGWKLYEAKTISNWSSEATAENRRLSQTNALQHLLTVSHQAGNYWTVLLQPPSLLFLLPFQLTFHSYFEINWINILDVFVIQQAATWPRMLASGIEQLVRQALWGIEPTPILLLINLAYFPPSHPWHLLGKTAAL